MLQHAKECKLLQTASGLTQLDFLRFEPRCLRDGAFRLSESPRGRRLLSGLEGLTIDAVDTVSEDAAHEVPWQKCLTAACLAKPERMSIGLSASLTAVLGTASTAMPYTFDASRLTYLEVIATDNNDQTFGPWEIIIRSAHRTLESVYVESKYRPSLCDVPRFERLRQFGGLLQPRLAEQHGFSLLAAANAPEFDVARCPRPVPAYD